MPLAYYQRRFWKETRKRERKEEDILKQEISKVETKAGMGRSPRPLFPAPGRHCRPRRQEPGTHWLTGLEPAPLRERPAGQDDTGQGCRLPLQHPDGGGAAGDLWGCCGERRWCGSRWIPVGSHLGDPGDTSGTGILRGHRAHCPGSGLPGAPLGEPGHDTSVPKDGWPCGCGAGGASPGVPGLAPCPASLGPAANHVQSPRAASPPGPSRTRSALRRRTGPGLRGPHLRGREEGGPDARGSSQCRGSPQHSLAPLRSGGRCWGGRDGQGLRRALEGWRGPGFRIRSMGRIYQYQNLVV